MDIITNMFFYPGFYYIYNYVYRVVQGTFEPQQTVYEA